MEQLTLDQFGRIEIPEKIRQQLGINHETFGCDLPRSQNYLISAL